MEPSFKSQNMQTSEYHVYNGFGFVYKKEKDRKENIFTTLHRMTSTNCVWCSLPLASWPSRTSESHLRNSLKFSRPHIQIYLNKERCLHGKAQRPVPISGHKPREYTRITDTTNVYGEDLGVFSMTWYKAERANDWMSGITWFHPERCCVN